ncbi:hypothetical protein [Streptomyces sp. NPDC023838]|uniref:hypothetical protein n=1 Tax=Streptomyces sp. NPDC023838 TaxID=3154325 RepID=UPI0033E8297A
MKQATVEASARPRAWSVRDQREVCIGLAQSEFGFVEGEAPRSVAGRVGFEFGRGQVGGISA